MNKSEYNRKTTNAIRLDRETAEIINTLHDSTRMQKKEIMRMLVMYAYKHSKMVPSERIVYDIVFDE